MNEQEYLKTSKNSLKELTCDTRVEIGTGKHKDVEVI